MIDFNKNTAAAACNISSNQLLKDSAPINRSKHHKKLKKNIFKKTLTEENKQFLKLIGLLK